ncbi:glycosyltransferase [Butyrivibrio sp. TB]|uniref:glycosyltransferase n=1 Tax=Butyrivibrio sp. TB TaxID=1520809 RepID=UPI0008BE5236|nr:glycosyltransferase [Butyrivibrio sp. TB]SEP97268.1 Glycosyltransferase involved in cell wall bisynthesis [Butyrivibrio sp. TB]
METFFKIIVVSFNAGENLIKTINSIKEQTFDSWEVIVKDGLSTDGSIDKLRDELMIDADTGMSKDGKFRFVSEKDTGIYDAMNTALNILSFEMDDRKKAPDIMTGVSTGTGENKTEVTNNGAAQAEGSYVYFLNCGDYLKDKDTLKRVHDAIVDSTPEASKKHIFYGDIYERITGQVVASNPKMDDFACYRNVPCHQACFYDIRLMMAEHFDTTWHIRADYEHFLRCVYIDKAVTTYVPVTVADYEGGGYSESGNAKVVSERERKQIVSRYLPKGKVLKYDLIMLITLAPLRTKIARSPKTAGIYNALKSLIYNRK